jgi:choline dehydrogenase-like flavoprotein
MILENAQQAVSAAKNIDVCIAGSGPAGMSLAIALEAKGLRVLVLEAGGQMYDEKSQALMQGRIVGDQSFDMGINRLRYFGGCSNHWGGFCRMLDDWDFRDKVDGVSTAWPIGKKDLDPFQEQARDILDIPCFAPDRPLNDMISHVQWTYSPPVNFAIKYKDHVKASSRLHVVFNAGVSNFVEKDGKVIAVEVRDLQNNKHVITAPQFALCAGGIENSRLLLWSNIQNEGRLVRQANALGKYWMEHPHYSVADALVTVSPGVDPDRRGRAFIAPSEKAIRERKMLNCALRLELTDYEGTRQLISDLLCVAPRVGRWAAKKIDKTFWCGMKLRAAWEQAPRESNQIRLGPTRDALGIPQVELHWTKTDLEVHTVTQAATLFGEYLAANNFGRVRLLPWLADKSGFPDDDERIGNHHMGGTRMSQDPRQGVVDGTCKVHGLSNLYVCGSSVFPSAGHANPTLTVVQIALRLATHLEKVAKVEAKVS